MQIGKWMQMPRSDGDVLFDGRAVVLQAALPAAQFYFLLHGALERLA